jgi:hypothetical protein
MNCTRWVRQENEDRVTGIDCAGMVDEPTLVRSAPRRRAVLGSNPPRTSRPETHGDAADADGRCSLASVFMAWVGHRALP